MTTVVSKKICSVSAFTTVLSVGDKTALFTWDITEARMFYLEEMDDLVVGTGLNIKTVTKVAPKPALKCVEIFVKGPAALWIVNHNGLGVAKHMTQAHFDEICMSLSQMPDSDEMIHSANNALRMVSKAFMKVRDTAET